MPQLAALDLWIVWGYFALTLVAGLAMTRYAGRSLEDYFLGGRKLPWYLLGIAGMASWFDLTGTMIITSFLYLLGPRGLFIEFRGGAVLVLAFLIAYTGKWHRRSGCMTIAGWMTYRFGQGRAAVWVRIITALMAVVTTIAMLAYLVRGASLFVSYFVPYPPMLVTAALIAVGTLYTMFAGFYGVVLTDLIQGSIILVACGIISFLAFHATPDAAALGGLALKVTGNAQWTTCLPQWHTTMPPGYEMYESLVLFSAVYLLRNVLWGMGTGGDSRYFGARSDRDCGLQSLLQGVMITFRWPMMIGFAVLGLVLVDRLFPDPTSIGRATAAVHRNYPGVGQARWHDLTSGLVSHPENVPAALAADLNRELGDRWSERLPLLGFNGTVDPEQILPAVMVSSVPRGLRGFLLVAMLAAMMSALTGTVNQTSALMVCDLYQNGLRPRAGNRELILASYGATIFLTGAGFWMGVNAGTINELWGWIIMGLGGGSLAPFILRLYWWRCNAWGIAAGTLMGAVGAVVQRVTFPELVEWKQFFITAGLSFAGTILGSLATGPTPRDILRRFYRSTRPFGFWGPLETELTAAERASWRREHRNDILAVPFLLLTQVTAFLLSMQLVIHAGGPFWLTLALFVCGFAGSYWFWWRALPAADDPANGDKPAADDGAITSL